MTSKAAKGNVAKYSSYAYAFKRINQAMTDGYYLEAITICESIITDRLLSYGEYITKKDIGEKATLGKVLTKIKKDKNFVINEETEHLLEEVDLWRGKRNRCVHAVAKSKPGTPTSEVGDFLAETAACAATGKYLARKVSDWHKKIKKEHAKSSD
jgi:hypothetical protein